MVFNLFRSSPEPAPTAEGEPEPRVDPQTRRGGARRTPGRAARPHAQGKGKEPAGATTTRTSPRKRRPEAIVTSPTRGARPNAGVDASSGAAEALAARRAEQLRAERWASARERWAPAVDPHGDAFVCRERSFVRKLMDPCVSIGQILASEFSEHEARLALPADRKTYPTLARLQDRNTERYEALIAGPRFEGKRVSLALKFTMFWFGMPISPFSLRPLQPKFMEWQSDSEDSDEEWEEGALRFLNNYTERHNGADNWRMMDTELEKYYDPNWINNKINPGVLNPVGLKPVGESGEGKEADENTMNLRGGGLSEDSDEDDLFGSPSLETLKIADDKPEALAVSNNSHSYQQGSRAFGGQSSVGPADRRITSEHLDNALTSLLPIRPLISSEGDDTRSKVPASVDNSAKQLFDFSKTSYGGPIPGGAKAGSNPPGPRTAFQDELAITRTNGNKFISELQSFGATRNPERPGVGSGALSEGTALFQDWMADTPVTGKDAASSRLGQERPASSLASKPSVTSNAQQGTSKWLLDPDKVVDGVDIEDMMEPRPSRATSGKDCWVPLYGYRGCVYWNTAQLNTFEDAIVRLLDIRVRQSDDLRVRFTLLRRKEGTKYLEVSHKYRANPDEWEMHLEVIVSLLGGGKSAQPWMTPHTLVAFVSEDAEEPSPENGSYKPPRPFRRRNMLTLRLHPSCTDRDDVAYFQIPEGLDTEPASSEWMPSFLRAMRVLTPGSFSRWAKPSLPDTFVKVAGLEDMTHAACEFPRESMSHIWWQLQTKWTHEFELVTWSGHRNRDGSRGERLAFYISGRAGNWDQIERVPDPDMPIILPWAPLGGENEKETVTDALDRYLRRGLTPEEASPESLLQIQVFAPGINFLDSTTIVHIAIWDVEQLHYCVADILDDRAKIAKSHEDNPYAARECNFTWITVQPYYSKCDFHVGSKTIPISLGLEGQAETALGRLRRLVGEAVGIDKYDHALRFIITQCRHGVRVEEEATRWERIKPIKQGQNALLNFLVTPASTEDDWTMMMRYLSEMSSQITIVREEESWNIQLERHLPWGLYQQRETPETEQTDSEEQDSEEQDSKEGQTQAEDVPDEKEIGTLQQESPKESDLAAQRGSTYVYIEAGLNRQLSPSATPAKTGRERRANKYVAAHMQQDGASRLMTAQERAAAEARKRADNLLRSLVADRTNQQGQASQTARTGEQIRNDPNWRLFDKDPPPIQVLNNEGRFARPSAPLQRGFKFSGPRQAPNPPQQPGRLFDADADPILRSQAIREYSWHQPLSIRSFGQVTHPINAPPIELIIEPKGTGNSSVPSYSVGVLTPSEQRRLQESVHHLRNIALERVQKCPYAGCAYMIKVGAENEWESHLRYAHEADRCALCDDASFAHLDKAGREAHFFTAHADMFVSMLAREFDQSATSVIDLNRCPQVERLFRWCPRCGRNHTVLNSMTDRTFHDNCCYPDMDAAVANFMHCRRCGERHAANAAEEHAEVGCISEAVVEGPYCHQCGVTLAPDAFSPIYVKKHEYNCRRIGAARNKFGWCPWCGMDVRHMGRARILHDRNCTRRVPLAPDLVDVDGEPIVFETEGYRPPRGREEDEWTRSVRTILAHYPHSRLSRCLKCDYSMMDKPNEEILAHMEQVHDGKNVCEICTMRWIWLEKKLAPGEERVKKLVHINNHRNHNVRALKRDIVGSLELSHGHPLMKEVLQFDYIERDLSTRGRIERGAPNSIFAPRADENSQQRGPMDLNSVDPRGSDDESPAPPDSPVDSGYERVRNEIEHEFARIGVNQELERPQRSGGEVETSNTESADVIPRKKKPQILPRALDPNRPQPVYEQHPPLSGTSTDTEVAGVVPLRGRKQVKVKVSASKAKGKQRGAPVKKTRGVRRNYREEGSDQDSASASETGSESDESEDDTRRKGSKRWRGPRGEEDPNYVPTKEELEQKDEEIVDAVITPEEERHPELLPLPSRTGSSSKRRSQDKRDLNYRPKKEELEQKDEEMVEAVKTPAADRPTLPGIASPPKRKRESDGLAVTQGLGDFIVPDDEEAAAQSSPRKKARATPARRAVSAAVTLSPTKTARGRTTMPRVVSEAATATPSTTAMEAAKSLGRRAAAGADSKIPTSVPVPVPVLSVPSPAKRGGPAGNTITTSTAEGAPKSPAKKPPNTTKAPGAGTSPKKPAAAGQAPAGKTPRKVSGKKTDAAQPTPGRETRASRRLRGEGA